MHDMCQNIGPIFKKENNDKTFIKKKKKTAVKVAYCLTYSWFRDTLYN